MQINEETQKWATRKLMRFAGWRGFPTDEEGIAMCVRAFLRLVHNRPVADIMREAMAARGMADYPIDWDGKGMTPQTNDADWVLDLIAETLDRFPLPVEMREIYAAKLVPASTFGKANG